GPANGHDLVAVPPGIHPRARESESVPGAPEGRPDLARGKSERPLVWSIPASLRHWLQCRGESCSPPEALTSSRRLLPPARAEGIGTSCGSTAHHKDRLARGPRRRLTPTPQTLVALDPFLSPGMTPMTTTTGLDRIGVGIDTARSGHRPSFLGPDLNAPAQPPTVTDDRAGYQALRQRLEQLRLKHPLVHFHIRIDAAGQYAANLEQFLRGLDLPMTLSIGEPKRNKDYRMAHFPKRTSDDTHGEKKARFALVERPPATPAPTPSLALLRELVGRLQGQVKQTTRATNRLHNLTARTFPELAHLTEDIAAGWVLHLLRKYPTAERVAAAHLGSLEKIPYLDSEKARAIHQAAGRSVASLRGPVAEALVGNLVAQVVSSRAAERELLELV